LAAEKRRPHTGRNQAQRFYAQALTEAERSELPAAAELAGVDQEIALLRVRIKAALASHPEDLPLMFRGLDLLTRMLVRRYGLTAGEGGGLTEALASLRDEFLGLMEDGSVRR
jgi:hypothetical protein